MGGGSYALYLIKDVPSVAAFDRRKIAESSKIYDRTGTILLYEIHGEEKRTIIPLTQIQPLIQDATLATEDSNFYTHGAVDWKSIIRALFVNIAQGKITQGGSTITQQLAKNAFLSPERTLTRKIKELLLAIKLERHYTKDQILELYLNQIPYGANSYGIQAASQTYFKKNTTDLTLKEIVLLVSLPNAPSYYSPWGQHKAELEKRANGILEKMFALGKIDKNELSKAKKENPEFTTQTTLIKAPHFVMEVIDYLRSEYGENVIETAGWNITTTLDWELQQTAEKIVREGADRNKELYGGTNAALVAEDATTGQILALVGSKDYFSTEIDGNFNVATQGLRQPGSALKPFVYLTAFQKGFTPDTLLFDLETEFDTTDDLDHSYKPQNFDEQFRGPVRMKEALAQSLNVPAVKTLYLAGIDNVLKTTKSVGLSTLTERSRYGLSLVLGGGEVKLIELVGAYSVFAQEGLKHKSALVLRIEEQTTKKIIENYVDRVSRVIESQYARVINNILSDIDLRKKLFERSLSLTVFPNQEVALKTGTTNDYRDAWALGYTNSIVVGVWAGNNDNTPMERRGTSILAAVPIWSAFMNEVLKNKPLETFTQPDPIVAEKPMLRGELVVNNDVHDILFYVDKKNPLGPEPNHPEDDSQFINWEEPVDEWLKTHPVEELKKQFTDTTPGTTEEKAAIVINSPTSGMFIHDRLVVDADIVTGKELKTIELLLNNLPIDPAPFTRVLKNGNAYHYHGEFTFNKIDLQNILKIRAIDAEGAISEQQVIFFR